MSTLRTNALEGVDAKNSITIVAGAGNITTTNVQEGLCKAWCTASQPGTVEDSFNVSSQGDGGTGDFETNLTNNMSSVNSCPTVSCQANDFAAVESVSTSLINQFSIQRVDVIALSDLRAYLQVTGDLA